MFDNNEAKAPEPVVCFWCGTGPLDLDHHVLCDSCRQQALKSAEANRLKGWKTTGRPES